MASQGYHCKLNTVLSADDVGNCNRLILKVLSGSNWPKFEIQLRRLSSLISPIGSMVPARDSTLISRQQEPKLNDITEKTHRH
jgi:hypothetical protein